MSARGEFAWIARFAEILGAAARPAAGVGIGDDAAVIEGPDGFVLAWTVDTLVEGRHFRFDWIDPADVGRRALVASLSDLAATGAEPCGALVAMTGPEETFDRVGEGIYEGLAQLAESSGCPILGGDLARADGALHITTTLLGPVVAGDPLTRAGARAGDVVWVTGRLGGPAAAIAALDRAGSHAPRIEAVRTSAAYRRLVGARARVDEARWLRERVDLTAGIDLSDGLSGDAAHVAERSGVEVALEADRIPLHPGASETASQLGRDPRPWALHGGEEWELLVTAGAGALEPLADPFEREFGIPLTRIGEIRPGSGVALRDEDGERPLEAESWDHFRTDR